MSPKGGYVIGILRIHFDADEEFEESPFKVEWQTDMTILELMPLPKAYEVEREE